MNKLNKVIGVVAFILFSMVAISSCSSHGPQKCPSFSQVDTSISE
jgi:hypothetical protein